MAGKPVLTEGQKRHVEELRNDLKALKKRFARGEGRVSPDAAKKLQEQVAAVVRQITNTAYELIGNDPQRRAKLDAAAKKVKRFASKLPFPKSKSMRGAVSKKR